ncbi:hypothetical protein RHSIM_Rhsim06G0020500 [Rhododendron simsii]|uniref:Uncharacterized protein n=1 Tax=Rhododendron simsii TaxID=118357 RepID=A0A834H384_RHOSS|nr:hypothetical protein RHSIM_Rhsim06G0020500 [Rhododendron simsii]
MAQFRLLISLFSLTLPPLFISGVFSSGTVTLLNNCDQDVWSEVRTAVNTGSSQASTSSSFVLQKGQSKIIDGQAGRPGWRRLFWGRTGCAQNQLTGEFSCVTGNCGTGTLECDPFSRDKLPATLAEISLDNGLVSYDVSLVDGYC